MLTTLLESRSHHARDGRGAALSVAVHATFIFAAVYATATGAPAKDKPLNPPPIHWVKTPPPPSRHVVVPDAAPRTSATVSPAQPIVVPIEIPTSLPSIELQAQPVTPTDFVRGTPNSPGVPDQGAAANGRRAYEASEVEIAVSVIGTAAPEYPSSLRNAGIEGKVVAEFVVTELGRADERSLRVISATNDGFVDAIRRALPKMKFRPARIGERAVAQLVQQQFVFKLDR